MAGLTAGAAGIKDINYTKAHRNLGNPTHPLQRGTGHVSG